MSRARQMDSALRAARRTDVVGLSLGEADRSLRRLHLGRTDAERDLHDTHRRARNCMLVVLLGLIVVGVIGGAA